MTPPGFAAAPTRFVFPPPAELLEPPAGAVYEYGFQDFPNNALYQAGFPVVTVLTGQPVPVPKT